MSVNKKTKCERPKKTYTTMFQELFTNSPTPTTFTKTIINKREIL